MTRDADRDEKRIRERQNREQFNVFSRLAAINAASRKQGQHLLRTSAGLTIIEWRVLWDLCSSGPMTIRDLAEIHRVDHSLLSRALPEIQRKGLVKMERDTNDKRQTILNVTAQGEAAYLKAAPTMARRRAALRDKFSEDEISDFIGYLDRLEEFLHQPTDTIENKEPAE